jgi:hypothetical protein
MAAIPKCTDVLVLRLSSFNFRIIAAQAGGHSTTGLRVNIGKNDSALVSIPENPESLAGVKVCNSFNVRLPEEVLPDSESGEHEEIARCQGCGRICIIHAHFPEAKALRLLRAQLGNMGSPQRWLGKLHEEFPKCVLHTRGASRHTPRLATSSIDLGNRADAGPMVTAGTVAVSLAGLEVSAAEAIGPPY